MNPNHPNQRSCRASLLAYCFRLLALAACPAQAESVTALYSFTGGADGAGVWAGLIEARDGNLYGATTRGGLHNSGTIFRISKAGEFAALYSFSGGADGAMPVAALIQGRDGHLYGTTSAGGSGIGFGTVFRISTSGVLTTLHVFGANSDGAFPFSGLVEDAAGQLYGTTYGGVITAGTIFRLSPSGQFGVLHALAASTDGSNPEKAALLLARDGNLYGTTSKGGDSGRGTLFKVTRDGVFTRLYAFQGADDGGQPVAGLVEGSDGKLYGTASQGGAFGFGTVYQVDTSGTFKLLHAFSSRVTGIFPMSSLIEMPDGWFYGTTSQGGTNGFGTIFGVDSQGNHKIVASFSAASGGNGAPSIGLTRGSDGNLYGTANTGGANRLGTVYRVTGTPVVPDPVLLQSWRLSGQRLSFSFATRSEFSYAIETATNPAGPAWTTVSNLTGTGAPFEFSTGTSNAAAFFRLRRY